MARQRIDFGPWSSSLDSGTRLELSAFWRRRMAGLARLPLGRRVNRRWTAVGVIAAVLMAATPLIEFSPLAASDQVAAAIDSAAVQSAPFVWKFSSGAIVELIGIAEAPSKGNAWWQPDGSPLTGAAPPNAAKFDIPGDVVREFALRLENLPNDPPELQSCSSSPEYAGMGGGVVVEQGDGSQIQVEGISFRGAVKQMTLRVTVCIAKTPWQTVFSSDGRSASAQGSGVKGKPRGLAFAPAYETKAGTVITATFNLAGDDGRVIAIDQQDQTHTASRVTQAGVSGFVQATFTFEKLPLDQVKQFELQMQSRQSETVEFRNVSLDARHATKVEVAGPGGVPRNDQEELLSLIQQSLPKSGEKFDRTPILGPITSGEGGGVRLDPPSDDEVLGAYERSNSRLRRMSDQQKEEFNKQVERIEKKQVSEAIDPVRDYPKIGLAQHVHTHYRCILHLKGGATHELYVDHNHLHVTPAEVELKFGEVVERFVKDDNPDVGDFLIDFETGKVSSPPVDLARDKIMEWVKENGVDAMGEMNASVQGLMGFDMIVIPTTEANWNPSPGIFAQLDQGKAGTPATMSGRGKLPATFHVLTREGTRGVLQIVEVVGHEGVKIRYKLATK